VIGTDPRIAFEVNAGGGLKVPVDETWDMRTDARWFKSFGRHASEHWRVSHGISSMWESGERIDRFNLPVREFALKRIVIVGGGVSGLAAGCLVARRGQCT
jgi:hypothetical protein